MTIDIKHLRIEDLVAAHATDFFPENGLMRTLGNYQIEVSQDGISKAKVQIPRETLHFSLNGIHTQITSTNGSGNWANKKYAVIIPLQDIIDRFAVLDSMDSYTIGNYQLKDNAEIIVDRENLSEKELRYLIQLAKTDIKHYNHLIEAEDILDNFLPEPIYGYAIQLNGSKVRLTVKPKIISLTDFVGCRISQKGYIPMKIGAWGWVNQHPDLNEKALTQIAEERNLLGGGTNRLLGKNPHERSYWSILETAAGLLSCELESPKRPNENRASKQEEYKQIIEKYYKKIKEGVKPANSFETEAMQRIESTVIEIFQRYVEYKQEAIPGAK